jgi:hypothetical protein
MQIRGQDVNAVALAINDQTDVVPADQVMVVAAVELARAQVTGTSVTR